jgi:diguanylate cyclase (GGDEF)-like protein
MRRGVWGSAAFYAVTGTLVLAAIVRILNTDSTDPTALIQAASGSMIALDIVGIVFAFLVSTRCELSPQTRRAWRWIGAAFVLQAILPLFLAVFSPQDAIASPVDLVRLLFPVVMLVGLLSLPQRRRMSRRKLLLDVGTVLVGGAMVIWYLVVGPVLAMLDVDPRGFANAAILPIGDLVLLFGVALALVQGVDTSVRSAMGLLAAALLVDMTGNVYSGYQRAHTTTMPASSWLFLTIVVSHFLFAVAAFEQFRTASRPLQTAPLRRSASRLPYVAVLLSCGLLLFAAVREPAAYPWLGLVTGAVLLTVFVMTRQVLVLRENHQMAITDGLTGLANRSRLHDALGHALARSARNGRPVAVLLADLNGFKEINDTLGHAAGDQLLVTFADMLRRSVLGSDVVGRLGGDEFAIVLPDIGQPDNTAAVLRRIRQEMETPVMTGDVVVQIRAALGIAVATPGETDSDALMHRADQAMYADKRAGKEGIDPDSDFADALDGACERDEMRVHYQPIVDLANNQMTGVEALARWERPGHGTVPPDVFIPVAEKTGAIVEIGAWVLIEACAQASRWPGLDLAVNVSAIQLTEGFADRVIDTLRAAGLAPARLVVEVTETVRVDNATPVAELQRLNDAGVKIALDDFGTGYSTLRYLTQLPINILKIDRSFVAGMNGTPQNAVVADTVLRLGRMMNLTTIAEGVESPRQADELAELGCRQAQGYLFARPVPAGDIDKLLRTGLPMSGVGAPRAGAAR